MRRIAIIVGMAVVAASCMAGAASDLWQTDFAKASAEAKEKSQFMLLNFSGSDWCGWCMKLDKEVFSRPEFRAFAQKKLVCVLLDYPRRKAQSAQEKAQNEKLAQKYGVEGFPTIILLSPTGELAGQTGYAEGGPQPYIAKLQGMIDAYGQQKAADADPAAK